MSFRDPYAEAGRHQPQEQYGPADYSAYSNVPQRHQTYDGGLGFDPYTDEAAPRVVRYAGAPSQHSLSDEANKESTFQHEPYPPAIPKER